MTWDTFFSTMAESAATLTGLIFVGVSLNLQRIISIAHLPLRALVALMLMANILIICSFCLIPGQTIFYNGAEILVLSLILYFFITRVSLLAYKEVDKKYKFHYFRDFIFNQLAILPYPAAGVVLLSGSNTGFYLIIPGIIISIMKALTDSWVLLVEINR